MTQASRPLLFGHLFNQDIYLVTLSSSANVKISFLNYGALIQDWQVPLKDGSIRHVVCGFDQFNDYPEHSPYFGAIVGRVANRISKAKFKDPTTGKEYALDNNEGQTHLHGGTKGLGKRVKNFLFLTCKNKEFRFGK